MDHACHNCVDPQKLSTILCAGPDAHLTDPDMSVHYSILHEAFLSEVLRLNRCLDHAHRRKDGFQMSVLMSELDDVARAFDYFGGDRSQLAQSVKEGRIVEIHRSI